MLCFSSTTKLISYTNIHTCICMYIPSFLDFLPVQVTTELWIEFPVLYSRFSLVFCFICSSIYMSIPISQFIPSTPFPFGIHKFFLCICISVSALQMSSSVPFFSIPHKSINIRYLFFCLTYSTLHDGLLSLSMLLQMYCFIPFHDWMILHCIYVSHLLYPFLCWWAFRLPPCPGYSKQCCSECWDVCIFFCVCGEYNCFTILCQFLRYKCLSCCLQTPLPLEPLSVLSHPFIPPLPVITGDQAELPGLHCSFSLAILHTLIYVCTLYIMYIII